MNKDDWHLHYLSLFYCPFFSLHHPNNLLHSCDTLTICRMTSSNLCMCTHACSAINETEKFCHQSKILNSSFSSSPIVCRFWNSFQIYRMMMMMMTVSVLLDYFVSIFTNSWIPCSYFIGFPSCSRFDCIWIELYENYWTCLVHFDWAYKLFI